jgi:hypothetical protein
VGMGVDHCDRPGSARRFPLEEVDLILSVHRAVTTRRGVLRLGLPRGRSVWLGDCDGLLTGC